MEKIDLIRAVSNNLKLKYKPTGDLYEIGLFTLIKNNDGTWSDGVNYISDIKICYTRKITQLDKFEIDNVNQ